MKEHAESKFLDGRLGRKTYHSLRWLVVQVPVALRALTGDARVRLDASRPKRADDFQVGAIVEWVSENQIVE